MLDLKLEITPEVKAYVFITCAHHERRIPVQEKIKPFVLEYFTHEYFEIIQPLVKQQSSLLLLSQYQSVYMHAMCI